MGLFYGFSLKKGLFLLKMGFFRQKCPRPIGGILRYFRPILRLNLGLIKGEEKSTKKLPVFSGSFF